MDETRILPGEQLVSKGALKLNSSLPEVGLKDVSPNGSWLEQKQIQAALEARKHLIEVERIEKSGVLSHAEWCEELMLAEVTQKVGGYWQYLGHNVGKRLFLNPEEALYLMETNCLLLKYNDVKVSLQQAYALMLRSKISLVQYKVYASLSRLGYKVFRHRIQPVSVPKKYDKKVDNACSSKINAYDLNSENNLLEKNSNQILADVNTEQQEKKYDKKVDNACSSKINADDLNSANNVLETDSTQILADVNIKQQEIRTDEEDSLSKTTTGESDKSTHDHANDHIKSEEMNEIVITEQASTSENIETKKELTKISKLKHSKCIQYKILKLKSRKYKLKDPNNAHNDSFGNIPDFTKYPIVAITAPDQRYLPSQVALRTKSYFINVEKIRTKPTVSEEIPSSPNSPTGSMNPIYPHNLNHLRHTSPHSYRASNWTEYFNFRFSSQPNPFRHFNFWRPPTANLNYFQFNMTFQRPFLYPQYGPRGAILNSFLQPLTPNFSEDISFNSNNDAARKKRSRHILKQEHYASIVKLASFVKNCILKLELRFSGSNVSRLNELIQTYNTRYKTRLRLSPDFSVIVDENIIDTIEVDDDDDPIAKRAKNSESSENSDAFNSNLQRLKQLAHKLKDLEMKNESTSRNRRIFSQLLKRFNTTYSIDYYVNDNFDVINRNDLTMLSSSDSDGVVETKVNRRKKLKNPFSILKQMSERHLDENCASTSSTKECPFEYNEVTVKTFKKDWLPDISDFGRAEVVSQDIASEVIDSRREEFLFDFLKIQPDKFKNWLDIKISFLQCLQQTCDLFHYEGQKNIGLESLVKPAEFNNAALVLKKLSIFENPQTMDEDTILEIDFDVYNRNVQNFKKSNRPVPHFRVICLKESSTMPSGADVAGLHSQYKDDVTIMVAVVGVGSISYLQVNPVALPVYTSSNIITV